MTLNKLDPVLFYIIAAINGRSLTTLFVLSLELNITQKREAEKRKLLCPEGLQKVLNDNERINIHL